MGVQAFSSLPGFYQAFTFLRLRSGGIVYILHTWRPNFTGSFNASDPGQTMEELEMTPAEES